MKKTLNNTSEFEREPWIDVVRTIAIFLVVLLHAAAPWVYRYGLIPEFDWQVGNIIDSATRVAVPLFFMSTGYLLLSKPLSLKTYFNKRVSRVAIPWIAWSVIYLLYRNLFADNPVTFSEGLLAFLNGDVYFHFWFLYTLIGLYLFIPVISWLLESDPQKRSLYFLIAWFVAASLIPFLNILSRSTTNFELKIALDLSMFGGFTGYLIAGFLIGKFNPSRPQWILLCGVYLISIIITILGTSAASNYLERLVEYLYDYAAPNIILAGFAAFAVLKKIGILISQNQKVSLIFSRLGYASLGIYLIHPIFINALNHGMLGPNVTDLLRQSALAIPLVAIITFLLSYTAIEIILFIPILRRIV